MFNIAFFFLGVSAAVFGTWVERVGPRMAMLASATCFASGFFVSALGVKLKLLFLLYAGYGVLGGIGLGLGYISPVSTRASSSRTSPRASASSVRPSIALFS
jgi:MFS family permease